MIDLTKRRFKGTHDMIDLTKPFRLKGRNSPARIANKEPVYRIQTEFGIHEYVESMIDSLFENIPEPRRPREWWITLDAGDITGVVTKALTSALWTARDNAKVIHVIEWPEGAPLPEWPE